MDGFSCVKCRKQFAFKKNLIRHVNTNACSSKATRIKCPECTDVFTRNELLKKHAETHHDLDVQEKNLSFENVNDFKRWKAKIEKENLCFYSVRSVYSSNNIKRTYHQCHRTGYFESESQGIRRIKSQGTNRINSTCISSMILIEDTDTNHVKVVYCKTHFGHESNLGRCHLSKDDRAMIAGKIAEGVTFDRLLDDIRDEVKNLYDVKTLTTRRDLLNVQRDFNLTNLIDGRCHQSDYISVNLWIEKMNQLPDHENPIVFHVQDATTFFLLISTEFQKQMLQQFGSRAICIDSTHGTNEYDFHLTTIVVIDEYGNGFPCSYCISENKDSATWSLYFQKLKDVVGPIKTEIFMSDDDPSFYNAWETIMGPVTHRLLCSWHVDQSWRKQLRSKVKGSQEKKALIYKTLKVIHHEPDVGSFEVMLDGFLEELENDSESKEFCDYLRSTYLNRIQQWAYCYRRGCGINTNMFLESVHKTLKYYYFRRKKNKRMDKCINALLKFTRNKNFDRFVKIAKNKYCLKEDNIVRSHTEAIKILPSQIHALTETSWEVESGRTKGLLYEVVRVRSVCNEDNCKLKCRKCNICSHIYVCECPDHVLKLNICKHIHACVLQTLENEQEPNCEDIHDGSNNNNLTLLETAICSKESKSDNKTQIIQKLETAIGYFQATDNFSPDDLLDIEKKADSLIDIIYKKKRKISRVENREPTNKNIAKQMRFVSKKSTNKPPSSQRLQPSSVSEKTAIRAGLKHPFRETQNIHSGFDHTYAN